MVSKVHGLKSMVYFGTSHLLTLNLKEWRDLSFRTCYVQPLQQTCAKSLLIDDAIIGVILVWLTGT